MEFLDAVDMLQLYRGGDIRIDGPIVLRQPTLQEICDFGEQRYFSMIYTLTAVGADLKWQLDELGLDYSKITDFDLFSNLLYKAFSQEDTRILLGDLDLRRFQSVRNRQLDEAVLYDQQDDIMITRYTYQYLVKYLRVIHGLKRNQETPGNEATRLILIEDARQEYEDQKNKPWRSQLFPLVSAMVNSAGCKKDETTVFDMKLLPFLDGVKRIQKIKRASLLLQSGYSGFGIDLKKIDREDLNWLSE